MDYIDQAFLMAQLERDSLGHDSLYYSTTQAGLDEEHADLDGVLENSLEISSVLEHASYAEVERLNDERTRNFQGVLHVQYGRQAKEYFLPTPKVVGVAELLTLRAGLRNA